MTLSISSHQINTVREIRGVGVGMKTVYRETALLVKGVKAHGTEYTHSLAWIDTSFLVPE